MKPFELDVLLWPASCILLLTLLVTYKVTHSPVAAVFAGAFKTSFYLLYYGVIFDGSYTFLDDWSYLQGGRELLAHDVGVKNLVENWELALAVGGGGHFVYYLYNAYAFRLFGEGYYAPVALNIMLTVMVAYYGMRLAVQEFGLSRYQGKLFYSFLLLHPDILAWSNIMNGKDIFVLLLHVLLLYSVSFYYRKYYLRAFFLGVSVASILLFLRFYVPLLFIIGLLISSLFSNYRQRMYYISANIVLIFVSYFTIGGGSGLEYAYQRIQEAFVNPIYGFVRMTLTPIPFNTEPAYEFLNIPAFIHWVMIPFAILGVIHVFRIKTHFSRFFITYIFVFIALYSIYGELQGPRHRVQLDYAFAVIQFIGLMAAVKGLKTRETLRYTENRIRYKEAPHNTASG